MKNILWAVFAAILTAFAFSTDVNAQAPTAQAQLNITWSAPTTGGPVATYVLNCTGSFPVDILTPEPAHSTAPIAVSEGETLAGSCTVLARNTVGDSDPVTASYSHVVSITTPPGPPTDFTITLDCTMVDGVVTCEQV